MIIIRGSLQTTRLPLKIDDEIKVVSKETFFYFIKLKKHAFVKSK